MKFFTVAASLMGLAYSVQAAEYLGKIEAHQASSCEDSPVEASIANAGQAGNCINTLEGYFWLKSITKNSGKVIDLHCYTTSADCINDPNGEGGALYRNFGQVPSNNLCIKAPENCQYLRAVVP